MALYLPFVQLEFTRALGPEPGRYPTGGRPNSDVLIIDVVGGPAARRRLSRRPRPASPGEAPAEIPLALATLVLNDRAETDPREAEALIDGLREEEREREDWIRAALATVNRAIAAYRVAAHDPYAIEVSRFDPRAVRIGYGAAEEVAQGSWRVAFSAPLPRLPRTSRTERLGISEVVAAVLAGRDRALASEESLVRAALDLAEGRLANAAAQLVASLDLLEGELVGEPASGDALERLAAISARRPQLERWMRDLAGGAPASEAADELGALAGELGALADELEALLAERRARRLARGRGS